jgi:AraC family transcriptional regulator
MTDSHVHRWPILCLVLEGAFTLYSSGRKWSCKSPAMLFQPQGEVHHERCQENGARLLVVEMDPRWFRRTRDQVRIEPGLADHAAGIVTALGRRLYREFLIGKRTSPLVVEGLVLEIIGEAQRHHLDSTPGYAPQWLQKAREILRARFAEQITLETLASAVKVHPVHLAQMFRKYYRCTIGAYIRTLRIEFASCELAESDMPLVEIALAAGFCDQSHFTKTFRQHTGVVPSEFRKSLR